MTTDSVDRFERYLKIFVFMIYVGVGVIILGVALGYALRPDWWGFTSALLVVGALTVAVGVREKGRGAKILAEMRSRRTGA
jgi:hypothetical protein